MNYLFSNLNVCVRVYESVCVCVCVCVFVMDEKAKPR